MITEERRDTHAFFRIKCLVLAAFFTNFAVVAQKQDDSQVFETVGHGRINAEIPAELCAEGLLLRDVAREAGIEFVHRTGFDGNYWFPEIVGGGAAMADLDGDGRLDLVAIDGGSLADGPAARHGLFRQRPDGSFAAVPDALPTAGYGQGCAVADYDGDGDLDLFVTAAGPNSLFRNDGDFRFTDVTAAAGLSGDGWSTSAAFGDLDGDGDLDLFVVDYCLWSPAGHKPCRSSRGEPDYCNPSAYEAAVDTYWRNRGDGTFENATLDAGVHATAGHGLGVVLEDFTGDGLPDVFVANDGDANALWVAH